MESGHHVDGHTGDDGDSIRRWVLGGLVTLLGVVTLGIPLFDIWEDTTKLSWGLFASLTENSPLLLLSLGIAGSGIWLARKPWDPKYHAIVVKWSYLVVGGVVLLYGVVVGVQLWAMHQLKPYLLLADGILFVTVAAVGMGLMAAHRRRTTDALRTSEERHRTLTDDVLDTSEVATFILDDDFSVIWINEATERYFGLDREAVVGRDKRTLIEENIADIFEEPDRFAERVTTTYEDNTYRENFVCHVLPGEDREERWLEHWSQPIESGLYAGGRIEHYTDVTEQREQEAELRDAKQQLEAAAMAGAVGTWEWHIPEDEMVVGPSFARLFGVDPEVASEGVSVEAFIDAIHEDDRDHVERRIDEALESCGDYEAEYRVWNEDDELRWVLARGHVECDEEGNPVTFPGALTDITEQKRAQVELEEREQSLRRMYDLISDPARSFDAKVDGLISIGRDLFDAEYGAFARIDAGSNEYELQVVQAESLDLRVGDVIPYTQTHCQRMVAANRTVQFETRPFESAPEVVDDVGGFEFGSSEEGEEATPSRDYGTDEEFEMYVGTPVSIGDEVYGALCFLDRDEVEGFEKWQLTLLELMGSWVGYELDRKQLLEERERRLRESEARFESIVETVDEYAIFTVDADGNVQNWNEGAKEILGYERGDVVGAPVTTLSTGEVMADPEDLLERVREEGRVTYDGWRTRKDGSQFYADVTISARYDADDDLAGYTVIIRDTTERRAYQETIEHERERLEFMNRFVRHNILNGLNLINARADLLQGAVDDESAQEDLALIHNRVRDMSNLVDTMRTFMDAVLADAEHELEPTSLREALERKVDLARESYDAEIDVHGLPAPSTTVPADGLLGEVFENVLSNAVVHNDEETPQVEVWATKAVQEVPKTDQPVGSAVVGRGVETDQREVLTVHVADNGPGLSDDEKDAILEKGASRFDEPGHGFGLYLVREMMETYGGEVDIRDNQPKGTVFDLTFPLADGERAEA